MRRFTKGTAAKLPLVEAVIIVAVFAVISVAIMKMYVAADRIQKSAKNISTAMIKAENVAERLRVEGFKNITLAYDENWEETSEEPAFTLRVETDSRQGELSELSEAVICVFDESGSELAQLNTKKLQKH